MIVGRPAGLGHAAKAEFIKHGKQDGKTGKAVGMWNHAAAWQECSETASEFPGFHITISFCLACPDEDLPTCPSTRA